MAPIDQGRRALLRGDIRNQSSIRHVPWAAPEFADLCRRCDECITACEESILIRSDGGFPDIDFARGGCTFCGACANACRYGAIKNNGQPAWNLKVTVAPTCLEAKSITCRACGEACETRAIRFFLRVGGGADLRLDQDICTGCGACVAVCPVDAVTIGTASGSGASAPAHKQITQPGGRA